MSDPMIDKLIYAVALPLSAAVVIVALTWVLLHRNAPMGTFLVLLLVVPLGLLQLSSNVRIHSWHTLSHSSIVYQIERGGVRPENPLMAGEPLRYYFGEHWLMAELLRIVPLAPTTLFALFNIAAAITLAVAL